jgi:hypothetical protein
VRRLVLLALALVLAGCGGDGRAAGTATLWVTRDGGQTVVYEGQVPAGLTAMQALDRKLDVETRYGGRFVEAIEGVEGDASRQRDWFWYVNGIEGDRSAAEYRLHDGDVEWWDYRSWRGQMRVPVVVGAFPEPFLHGYGGERRLTRVRYDRNAPRALAERLARVLRTDSVMLTGAPVPRGWNTFTISRRYGVFRAWGGSGGPVHFGISPREARRLLARPERARFRYRGLA